MEFKKIDKKYRPIPFWSWNERLDPKETARQVGVMEKAGMGGYFMHARGGLLTEYMGDEWFENVNAAIDEGERLGMDSWAYDENGWPSGFGDGKLLMLGEDYLLKYLTYDKTENYKGPREKILLERDGYTYYYYSNEFYVDLMNPAVTDRFIEEVYEVYKKKCGNRIKGFFTDEPQLTRFEVPWSIVTEGEFFSRYGYSIRDRLDALFFEPSGYEEVRFDFYKMQTELFSQNFFKRLYDWCDKNGYQLTGHLVMESELCGTVMTNGAVMPHYEYFHIPGVDWLGRPIYDECLLGMQLSSVAAQTGKRQVLTESYAMTGHNVSHGELKRILEWQMVHGVNLLCTHLEGYSNRGIRKRDYPAAIYYQQPWWEDADKFFDAMSRIGMILAEGEIDCDTLLIHPQSTVWTIYNGFVRGDRSSIEKIDALEREFSAEMRELEDKHILYHLGDETIMERHARVEDGCLVIGNMRYKNVIVSKTCRRLFDNTRRLLSEFTSSGGRITTAEQLPENPITQRSRLSYTKRSFEGYSVHYFVNSTNERIDASFSVGDALIGIEDGELYPFSGKHSFAPYESILILDKGSAPKAMPEVQLNPLSLSGEWEVADQSLNSITLDRCDYYFDGELIARDSYVLNILPRINALRRPVRLHQRYRFRINEMPEGEIYLVTETPEIFDITINGAPLEKQDAGYFRDISFRMLPMRDLLTVGVNTVELDSVISQSEKTYEHLSKSWTFETMSNSLSYDIEIEQIYVAGKFGVNICAPVTELENDAYRVRELATEGGESFAIVKAPSTVDISRLDASGYPQLAGSVTLSRRITVQDTKRSVFLKFRGANSVHLSVNGTSEIIKLYPPYSVDISHLLREGENELRLTVINNLRNMQGPSHMKIGEHLAPARSHFYNESNVFYHKRGAYEDCHDVTDYWDDDVCLVHFGLCEE